ncbi:MAG: protein kinase domain-containing protein [Thermoanaerobaculia bacterium]
MPTVKGGASIVAGTMIGRYRIERLLGAGGMGEVYAARDSQLGRTISLKLLLQNGGPDPARVERFIREAQLASSLSHPAVVTVFDSGEARLDDDRVVHFLAMELIDGEDLGRWARGRDPRKIAAAMAEVADGLAKAHASAIIHRDLKPKNIMVTSGGHPKILDFGVAKLTERAEGAPSETDTAPTAAIGTAMYMSPEQVEGRELDPRSDIFSFGSVLFEILVGKPPFQRATPVEAMHAILHDPTPSIQTTRRAVPPEMERIVRKCLVKEREERYQSIKDVALDLREVARDERPESRPAAPSRLPLLAGGLILAAVVILLSLWNSARVRREMPVEAAPQPRQTMIRMTNSGNILAGTISPDGNYIVYVTSEGEDETMWVKQIATATAVRIVPSQSVYYTEVRISPDGNYVYYGMAKRSEPNVFDLMRVPLLGGASRRIVADFDSWFALSPDGKQVAFRRFNAIERLFRVHVIDIDNGVERTILRRKYPDFLGNIAWAPDGRHITVVGGRWNVDTAPVLLNLDLVDGSIAKLKSPQWRSFNSLTWLPDGSGLIVTAGDQLQPLQVWFVPSDGAAARKITTDLSKYDTATVTADSKSIAVGRAEITSNIWLVSLDDPRTARALTTGLGNRNGMGGLTFLPDGSVLYVSTDEGRPNMRAVGRSGAEAHSLSPMAAWDPVVSPDGQRIAFLSDRSGQIEIWTSNPAGGELQQMTQFGRPIAQHASGNSESVLGASASPSWFPDSRSLAFVSMGSVQAAWKMTIGTPALERLTDAPANTPKVSPDGNWILCRLRSTKPGVPLWRTALVRVGAKEEPRYFDVPSYGGPPTMQWFPDGKRFAFVDHVAGIANLWVQDIDRSAPRQLTHFDAGEICGFALSGDSKFAAVSRCERVNDLVLIRGFR